MARLRRLSILFILSALCVRLEPGLAAQKDPFEARFNAARLAWDTGDYPTALTEFRVLLTGPQGSRYFEPIALRTGELFVVSEIAKDGRSVRFSPDGRWAAFETGPRTDPQTRIIAADGPGRMILDVHGTRLAFAPDGKTIAYLRLPDSPEVVKLRRAAEALAAQPAPDRQAQTALQRQLAWIEAKTAQLVLVDLASKKEKVLKIPAWLKASPIFSADGKDVLFVGAKETDPSVSEICAASQDGSVRVLTAGPGFKTNPVAVPGGKYILYTIAAATPFPAPQPPAAPTQPATAAAPAGGQPGPRGGGGAGFGGPRPFVLFSPADRSARTFTGTAPVLSADGSTLVFLGQEGSETTINVLKLAGDIKPVVVKRSAERIGSAAPAPDGSSVVFDMTYTRNGEIFVVDADGKNELRLSREIQPDRALSGREHDPGRQRRAPPQSGFSL
ncbi:MAG: hypothetical protein NTZ26_14645 [Candidatus Aminicenantes bacterium]|nr:hypothetical protein [Candidatus Aminicenantes bacterium]